MRMVARRAEKCGNSCSARHYDQIKLSFHTAWARSRTSPYGSFEVTCGHSHERGGGAAAGFNVIFEIVAADEAGVVG
jgi:hypothetical protein